MNRNKSANVGIRRCLGSCIALLLLCGCQKSELDRHIEESSVLVKSETDGTVNAKTNAANFRILPTGYIRAEFSNEKKPLVLDDANDAPAETLVVNGHAITDWVLAPARVRISNADGPIGKLGKRLRHLWAWSAQPFEAHTHHSLDKRLVLRESTSYSRDYILCELHMRNVLR